MVELNASPPPLSSPVLHSRVHTVITRELRCWVMFLTLSLDGPFRGCNIRTANKCCCEALKVVTYFYLSDILGMIKWRVRSVRGEMHTKFWQDNPKRRNHQGYVGIYEKIIVKFIWEKYGVCGGLYETNSGGAILATRRLTIGFHKSGWLTANFWRSLNYLLWRWIV
jgi:hypothetical protein